MKLYNTLTKKIEDIKPLSPPNLSLYTCGPTVYDHLQIGNWLTFIRWDLLARVLQAENYRVKWIMNITDVGHLVSDADEGEDKLEKGAAREGKSAWDVADAYTQEFLEGLDELNISVPRNQLPRATDNIQEQINLVKALEDKEYTYVIDDGVYFDTSKFAAYGQLARLDIEGLKTGARVEFNKQKKNPTDFALWKFSPKDKKRDMEWDSPWGRGFPGWHLECSAMAMKYLGETLDIHAGGIDLIPVHHTNEIAQSEAATGQIFANVWVHSNFLTVDGTKLSKSLGNSFTLENVKAKDFSPLDFRMFALQSHYRTESNFSWDNLEAAHNRLQELLAWADLQFQSHSSPELKNNYEVALKDFEAALSNDLDTPRALAILSGMVKRTEELGADSGAVAQAIAVIDPELGLGLDKRDNIDSTQEKLINERDQARLSKDWVKSDELRDTLKEQGIGVRDTDQGTIWFRL